MRSTKGEFGGVRPAVTVDGRTRLSVLHLAYEDHRRPGAGGGSTRTREINERLADRYEITVVCARYRGARARTENGVRYRFVGIPIGQFGSIITYFLFIPYALLRYRSDLVVEDFGAPFSTVGVPRMTSRPVIGVVQWLFATQKSEQYHLPFDVVERFGLYVHRNLIAVSKDLANELERRVPDAKVHVIANGLSNPTVSHTVPARDGILFLGRLDIAQKGLDLLLEAFALASRNIEDELLIGGDGPDAHILKDLVSRLGLADRVRFLGWVNTADRFDVLASAKMVVMPSRYETFGMVAAESLRVGTPVVGFDIPCLRELLRGGNGVLVEAFDVSALGEAISRVANDSQARDAMSVRGPASVAHLGWSQLSACQGNLYYQVWSSQGRRRQSSTAERTRAR